MECYLEQKTIISLKKNKQIIKANEVRFNIFRHKLHLVHDFSQAYNLVLSDN